MIFQNLQIWSSLLYAASLPAGKSNLEDQNLGNTGSSAKQCNDSKNLKRQKNKNLNKNSKSAKLTQDFSFSGKSNPEDKDLCNTGSTSPA